MRPVTAVPIRAQVLFALRSSVVLVTLMMACSQAGDLSRGNAARHIESHEFLGRAAEIPIRLGSVDSMTWAALRPDYGALEGVGLVRSSQRGLFLHDVRWTDKGRQEMKTGAWREARCAASMSEMCIFIPVAKRRLVEVLGVAKKDNEAHVDFAWRWTLTDLGAALQEKGLSLGAGWHSEIEVDKDQKGVALFRLYDDGWRLVEVR